MLKSLYITSTRGFSGKTAVCLGLALKGAEVGLKVGYFKPLGWMMARSSKGGWIDEDAVLMKESLNLEEPLDTITPLILNSEMLEAFEGRSGEELLKTLTEAYNIVSKEKNIMILEGLHSIASGAFFDLPTPRLAKTFHSKIIMVCRAENDLVVDDILRDKSYASEWNVEVLGVVFNNISQQLINRIEKYIEPCLKRFGIDTLGIIPENIELTAPTVEEINEVLKGKILAGKDGLNKLVQDFQIGAMMMADALRYFRRSINKAVITGGDRSDLALTALETSTSALILTGNIQPHINVLTRAEEDQVPVILVPYDTYTTVKLIERVTKRIRPQDRKKIEIAKKLFEENVDWKTIIS